MDVYDYVLQNCKEMDLKNFTSNRNCDSVFYSIVKTKQVVKLGHYVFISPEQDIKKSDFSIKSVFSLEKKLPSKTLRHIFFSDPIDSTIYLDVHNDKIKCDECYIDFPNDKEEYFNYNLLYTLPPYDELMKIKSVLDYITEQNSQIELQIYKANFNGCL